MTNILGVGIATLDIINHVEAYPAENTEVRANSQRFCRGGNVTNTLTVLSQFNHNCAWAGVLCDDYDARYILDDLNSNHIDYSYCQKQSSGKMPTSYILSSNDNGSRSIVHYRDLSELSFQHFKTLNLQNFDWIHFEGRAIDETEQMLRWCKQHYPHIPVSVEIEKKREHLEKVFNLADIYLYSKAFANASGFTSAESFLQSEQLKSPNARLICAWGELGSFALVDETFISSQSCPPKKIIDTLGAGDTFNAGIIHARLKHLSWEASLDLANQIAGKKCGMVGFNNLAGS